MGRCRTRHEREADELKNGTRVNDLENEVRQRDRIIEDQRQQIVALETKLRDSVESPRLLAQIQTLHEEVARLRLAEHLLNTPQPTPPEQPPAMVYGQRPLNREQRRAAKKNRR